MGEKGNMIDTAGLADIGAGVSGTGDIATAADQGSGSGHHMAGTAASVAKATTEHIKAAGDASVSKDTGLAGLLPTAKDEEPPAQR